MSNHCVAWSINMSDPFSLIYSDYKGLWFYDDEHLVDVSLSAVDVFVLKN
ncbi:hypothetical protein [Fulvivirga sp. M361]|nr:hypothetical protein [Fulvivirga sp. M361]